MGTLQKSQKYEILVKLKTNEFDGILNHTFMAKKPVAILTDANFWSSIS